MSETIASTQTWRRCFRCELVALRVKVMGLMAGSTEVLLLNENFVEHYPS